MTLKEKRNSIVEVMDSAINLNRKLFVFIAVETVEGKIVSSDLIQNMNALEVKGLGAVINDHATSKLEAFTKPMTEEIEDNIIN